jgi:hypothetical protein
MADTAAPISKVDSHSAVEAGDGPQGKKAAHRRASSTVSNAFSMVDLGKLILPFIPDARLHCGHVAE